jgi:SAM-dependent methyltransferase
MSARKLGLATMGVEPSSEAAAAARRAGLSVFTGYLEAARFPAASFDAATLIEVIEHLRDPRPLLAECRRVLKPGGILLITTPNSASWTVRAMGSRWDGFSLTGMGGHISFFNPGSMRMIAKHTGFEAVRIETRNVRFFERGQCPSTLYRAAKIVSELLNWPAQLLGQGHDMYAYLRARKP